MTKRSEKTAGSRRSDLKRLSRLLVPNTLTSWLSAIAGGVSILNITWKAYHFGLSAALSDILNFYNGFIGATLGKLTDPIDAFVRQFLPSIHLEDIWADVFVLTGIYFLRNTVRLFKLRKRKAAFYQLRFSLILMTYSGLGAGFSAGSDNGLDSQFMVLLFPISATFVMSVVQAFWFSDHPRDRHLRTWPDFGGPRWYFIAMQTTYGFFQAVGGALIGVILLLIMRTHGVERPAIAVLVVLVMLLALYWLYFGILRAQSIDGGNVQARSLDWMETVAATPAGSVALAMFHTLLVALGFALVNALSPSA